MSNLNFILFCSYFFKIGLLILSVFVSEIVSGQSCIDTIKHAANLYQIGHLEELIQLQIGRSCKDSERIELYRFQAEAYAALSQLDKAKAKIEAILKINQVFKPKFNDSERFKRLYQIIKRQNNTTLITTVTKYPDSLDMVAANVHIITHQEIEQRGYLNIGEIFYDIAGISISESSGTQHLHNRGLRTIISNQGILLLVDGVEQNNIWAQSINLLDQFPLSNIERIEIINGPQSTFYGANALTAVINIVTKKASQILPQYEPVGVIAQVTRQLISGNKDKKGNKIPKNSTMLDMTFMANLGNESILTVTAKKALIDRRNLTNQNNYIPQEKATYTDIFYRMGYNSNDSILIISDTIQEVAYTRAMSLDTTAYNKPNASKTHEYSTIDASLNINNFKFNLHFKDIQNETTNLFSDLRYLGILSTAYHDITGGFHIQYSKFVANDFYININSSYRIEKSTAYHTRLLSYQTGDLPQDSLSKNVAPFQREQTYIQQSQDFRTEIDFNYTGIDWIKIKGGLDFRNGLLQGNYLLDLEENNDDLYNYYHFFNDDLQLKDFDYQQYANLNIGSYLNLHIHSPKYKNITLSIGGRYEYIHKSPSNYTISSDTYYEEHSNKFFQGFYNEHEEDSTQFDEYHDDDDAFQSDKYDEIVNKPQYIFSPKIALVYKAKETLRDKLILKLLYNEGFQTVSQQTRLATLPSVIVNNPFISTLTKAKNFEFKANYMTNRMQLSTSIFNTNYDAVLTTKPYMIENRNISLSNSALDVSTNMIVVYEYENVKTQGIQLDAKVNIPIKNSIIDIFANYAYTNSANQLDTIIKEKEKKIRNQTIQGIAKNQFNIGLNLLTFKKRFNINIRMNYVSDRSIDSMAYSGLELSPDTKVPKYAVFHGAVTYYLPKQYLGLQLVVRNILNASYYHTGLGSADGSFYKSQLTQPSRQILLKAFFDLNRFDIFHRPKF